MSPITEDGPTADNGPPAAPPPAAPAAIYDPAHVPPTSAAYRGTPVPARLSVPDYTGDKFRRLRRRLLALGLLLAVPLVLFADRPFAGDATAVFRIDLVAWILFAAGLLLRAYAAVHLAARPSEFTTAADPAIGAHPATGPGNAAGRPGAAAGRLIESGPFGMLRHPLGVGGFLAGLGCALFTGAPVCLAAFVLAATGLGIASIVFEERRLIVAFPGPTLAYRARVPMLLPRRLRLERPPARPALRPLLWELLIALAFVLAALAIQALVRLAAQHHWPVIFRLG